jgi:hypothetical protein
MLPWERGSVTYEQIRDGLVVGEPRNIRRLSDYDLFIVLAEYPKGATGLAAAAELRRRETATARWALAISFLSLLISAATFRMKLKG